MGTEVLKNQKFNCLTCGVEFQSTKNCKTRTPKYCTKECFSKSIRTTETKSKQSEKKKGLVAWNKGLNMWDTREHPKGTLGKKFPERSGENSHLWKGGVSNQNELQRKSTEYKQWRKNVFERDLYTCQDCKKIGGRLHADHIKPFSIFKELRFNLDNGRTLCVKCHYKTDTYGGKMLKYENRNN